MSLHLWNQSTTSWVPLAEASTPPEESGTGINHGSEVNETNVGYLGSLDDLVVHASDYITLRDGDTLEGYRINGTIAVIGSNVTIRNCYIETGNAWGVDADGSTGLLMENCTIKGGPTTGACVLGDGGVYKRLNISGSLDGAKGNSGSRFEECYIHDLSSTEDSHNDGIQFGTANGVQVVRCKITARDTSAILMGGGEARAAAKDCLIKDNFLDGTEGEPVGYTFYGPTAPDGGTNVSGGPSQNIVVTGNVFGPNYTFGYVTQWEEGIGNVWANNTTHNGNPVTV